MSLLFFLKSTGNARPVALGFIGGASIHAYHEKHPIGSAAMQTWGKAPGWGSGWKKFIHENAGRQTGAYIQTTTFPYEHTWLDLDPVQEPVAAPPVELADSE